MAVSVRTNSPFRLETPKLLFQGSYSSARFAFMDVELNPWDISPDGRRFLMMKEVSPISAAEFPRKINLVINWFEELKQRVPVK